MAQGVASVRSKPTAPIGCRTQEDPIALAGGLNLYGFANGDPVTFTDPSGCRYSEEAAVDAWDRRLAYRLVNGAPVIESAGPDGVPGTADDVSLPHLGERLSDSIDVETECSSRRP
ncbi:MAG TPA: RHS repeat-associated core domain-containing protein [Gemmatimonadales bacterium]|nr:RHS repeat-associated core domain-containing protein [Gemmatimonadales bacterium]